MSDPERGYPGEITRLQERIAILERELIAVRSRPEHDSLVDSVAQSPIPVWATREERIVFANRAAADLLRADSPEDLAGRSVFDFVVPEFHDLIRARSRQELELGQVTQVVEQQMIALDGTRIDVQVTTLPFTLNGERARHVSFIDITERKSAERRLLEVNERFQELAVNIREVFSIAEPGGRVLYVSPGYELIWQRSCESLREDPASWLQAVHADDYARVAKAAESLETFKEDYRILRPSGETRWIRARTFPVRSEDGTLRRVVGFSEDITEWKKLEQQLIQSQKMDAVGRLAGGIAHDFNNLLTVINGYSAMLADRTDIPVDMSSDLRSIRRAGERAASLTAQLLAFSRTQTLQPKNIDLNVIVGEVELILRRLIREDVDLKTVFESHPVCVKADPTQIEQVILNLVINARDAIAGTGTITIETGLVEFDADSARLHGGCGTGRFAMIAVTDSGRGMSQRTQERIFEPFFTTKAHGQGTGLGLATVYGIVKQSGGTIWVYSEEGVGSTFKVYLPMAGAAESKEDVIQQQLIAGGTATVLIVEDEEQVRKIAATVLAARGYFVLEASNGEEALVAATAYRGEIHLLLTDVIMPRMGGPELARQLAAINPDLKVLFVSGYTENAVIHKGMIDPGLGHLAKPFTPDALARKVSEILAPALGKPGTFTARS